MAGRLKFCVTVTTAIIRRRLRGKRDLARAGFRGSVTVELALAWCISFASLSVVVAGDHDADRLKELQTAYVASASQKRPRGPITSGRRGPATSSRTTPATPTAWCRSTSSARRPTWAPSRARTAAIATRRRSRPSIGFLPENTVNPGAVYADQSDLYSGSEGGRRRGASSTCSSSGSTASTGRPRRPRPSVKTGKVYTEGKGSGLIFQDYDAGGTAQYGFVVTSPTHDQNRPDVDTQTIVIPATSVGGGYDARIAGPNPWTLGPLGLEGPWLLQGAVGQRGRPGRRVWPSAASCTPIPTHRRAPPR